MAREDLYKTLGVDKKATPEDVKKAYRKLARQYHPDRNNGDANAEARFKDVQAAYDVLGDPEKRKQYDRGGLFGGFGSGQPGGPGGVGGSGPGGFSGADFGGIGDILSDLFGRAGGGGGTGRPREPRPAQGSDLEQEVAITFEQAIDGSQVPISVATQEVCTTCRGSGAKPGTQRTICPKCAGRGVESQGQGVFSISQPCSRCHGEGTVVTDPCPTCAGRGVLGTVKKYRVNIPAGVRDGSRVRLAGRGLPGRNGGPAGDLYVITRVASSSVFERKGDHVEVEVPISFPEAARGAEVEVPTLDGRKRLRVPAGTHSGTVQRLRGEGPPKLGSKGRGDIHYRFVIDVPASLSKEQSDAVDELSKVMDGDPRSRLFQTS